MKMVYVYFNYNEIVAVFTKWTDALKAFKEDCEDDNIYLDWDAIKAECEERAYKKGDENWADVLWIDSEGETEGVIYQRPLN